LPKLTKVRSHGNNVHDVIIAHVLIADTHTYIYTYRRGNGKVILGPAGRAQSARPAGKKVEFPAAISIANVLALLIWAKLCLVLFR